MCALLVSSVAYTQWEPDVRLSTDEADAALNENMGQCIIANGDTVHVVWMDLKNKGQAIYYKRSTDKGVTWGPDTRISGTPGADSHPLLAQSGSTLHLVFLRNSGTPESASYYKRSTDGGTTWGPDVLLGNTKWWPGVAAAGSMVYVSLNTNLPDGNSVVYFRRSTDNGATWEPQQQISNATRRSGGRAEDPSIVADSKYVHLAWNDNRDSAPGKGMAVYYRRSSDRGATWGAETPLTRAPDYTYFPSIYLAGSNVDIPYGDRQTGHYDIYCLHSTDFGATWVAKEQITKTPTDEFYPAIVRDGSNVHMVWFGKEGVMYLHSGNGGTSWDPVVSLTAKGSLPFIAVAGEAVHVILVSRRDGHAAIYYKRNPTGNKPGSVVPNATSSRSPGGTTSGSSTSDPANGPPAQGAPSATGPASASRPVGGEVTTTGNVHTGEREKSLLLIAYDDTPQITAEFEKILAERHPEKGLDADAAVTFTAGSLVADEPRAVSLANGGFESSVPHEGWELHVYGAKPQVALERAVRHEGRQALRVQADAPSDVAFGQEVHLQPDHRYRLRGWVRTEGLDPLGARICGTFQIQGPGGRGVLAAGRNHPGTCDWTKEVVDFTAGPDGGARIVAFFAGFGKGKGTAWFDQVTLEEIDPAKASALTITRERLCGGTISPYQCGQFIEYLCALTPSMFAEKVFDGSFEGVPPYRVVFRPQTDRIEQPWYPDGAVNRGEYALDADNPLNGKVSQRIRQKGNEPCTLGISQGGISVRAGEALRCTLYLRAQTPRCPVRVAIWGAGKTYASAELQPTERWERYEATLVPTQADNQATLTISFRGEGTLWIDQVSLMPLRTVHGWRTDVAEAIKALRPGIIRFGGSTIEGFDWTATIGDPAKRVPFTTCWGGLEPGNAGLEEFVKLCQYVEAEPLICVRFSGKKPQDAAAQVEYFNGPATSPMGKLRAANGHREPYRVKYWQIGNELGSEAYQKGIADFCKAMKAVDPTIKLMASYPSPGLLQNAGAFLDYICPHHYGCQNLAGMDASVAGCRKMIAQHASGRDIRLGITEWNTTAGDFGLGRAMLWTLDNALWCSRYHNFMHRNCDMIEIANRSNLADSFCSGIIQCSNSDLFKTPTYYAQQLYAIHSGRYPLKVQTDPGAGSDPALDISATLSADERRVAIFTVNPTRQAQKRTLTLVAFQPPPGGVETFTLADTAKAGERDAANSWREPDRIRTECGKAPLADGRILYEFPPLSVTVLEVDCGKGPGQ